MAPPLTLIRTSLAGLSLPGQWLREVAAPVDFDEVDAAQRRALVRGLLAALHAPPGGVGLAATMAGLDLRLVIAEDAGRTLAMFNPEIVSTGGAEIAMTEGNLCLPGVSGEVVRPASLTVRWLDVDGRPHEERFDGWLARILFHELELLDGRFFTDHVARTSLSGLGGAAEPLHVLTLPPELHGLRRSVLRRPAAAVGEAGLSPRALERLVEALRLTLRAADLRALAAPQVGIGLRLAVVDDGDDLLTMIDPTVVERAQRIRVANHTPAGEPTELEAEGAVARRIEQALDQLDGVARPLGG